MLTTSVFPVFRRSPWPKWLRLSGLHGAEGRWLILEGVKPTAPATSDERNHGVASGCAARELLMLMLFLIMLMMMLLLMVLVMMMMMLLLMVLVMMMMMMMMIQYYGTLVLAANMVFSSIIGRYVYIYIHIYVCMYIYMYIYMDFSKLLLVRIITNLIWIELDELFGIRGVASVIYQFKRAKKVIQKR